MKSPRFQLGARLGGWMFSLVLVLSACTGRELPTAVPTPPDGPPMPVAGTCVVTTTADAGDGSLRARIADPDCSTITFDLTLPATITLTSGQLTIDRDVAIEGPGADELTVARSSADGTPAFRIFVVGPSAIASIAGVTVTNGLGTSASRDDGSFEYGGGIYNRGRLTLSRVAVTGNSGYTGGGVMNHLFIAATDHSGLTITHSVISNNSSEFGAGGIENNRGTMTVAHTTVSDNHSVFGAGGLISQAFGTTVITHSTIAGNSAEGGTTVGGIYRVSGDFTLRSSVVTGNSGGSLPDLKTLSFAGVITVTHSLIGSPEGHSITSTPENGNLVGTADTPIDPKLGPLALNAPGSTATHALLEGSPAIDNGVCTDLRDGPVTDDQRGITRPQGATCDIGAYEFEITADPCVVTSIGDAGAGSLRAANANNSCATITFDLALPATITLTSGGMSIFRDLSIEGPGADKLTVARSSADGTPEFRIFSVGTGNRARISGLTITNGRTASSGGGIFNDGGLTLSRVAVIGNAAEGSGGGIDNSFNMTITHSVIANNSSGSRGGGISHSGVSLGLDHSTVSGNRALTSGGGINNPAYEDVTVRYSTIVGNVVEAPDGRGGGIRTSNGVTIVRSSVVAGNSAADAPDVTGASGPGVLTVTHSLIGSPQGNSITSTPADGNLIGTADTPLDPMLGPLALNAPGSTATHALLEGSPAIDAGVCTDGGSNAVTDDQRGFARPQGATCDMGAYELEILTISTTTTLSISPSTQQYSDNVSLTASVLPASATGSVQFRKSVDGGTTFTDLGSPVTVATGSAALTDHQVLQAAGTAVQFKAVFTASGNFANSTSDATPLTVTHEDATIGYAAGNVAALQVSVPGGSLAANALTLAFTIKETEPDLAAATKGIGTITAAGYAGFTVSLAPVAGGTSILLTCTAGAVTGTGYGATRPYSCKNSAALPVNTYEVVATVTGDYYAGTYTGAFTVFDPSLGFATGGGSFVLGGEKVNFGFTMKYGKNGTNLKGNFIAVRHHADGTVSRLKANALSGLALGEDPSVPMGWASFTGKATYTKWDATAGAYVTLGNQSFTVYAEDRNNPGVGIDRIWLGAPFAMSGQLAAAKAGTMELTGGGIGVPHKAGKK